MQHPHHRRARRRAAAPVPRDRLALRDGGRPALEHLPDLRRDGRRPARAVPGQRSDGGRDLRRGPDGRRRHRLAVARRQPRQGVRVPVRGARAPGSRDRRELLEGLVDARPGAGADRGDERRVLPLRGARGRRRRCGSPPPTGSRRRTSRWCAGCALPVADALLDELDAEVAAHAEGYDVHTLRRRPAGRAAGVLLLPGEPARGRRPDRRAGLRGGDLHPRGVPARGGARPQGRPHGAAQPRRQGRADRRAQRPADAVPAAPAACSGPRSCTATTADTASGPR